MHICHPQPVEWLAQTALANSHGRGLLAAIARRSPSPYFFGGACGPGVDTQPVCAGASVSHGPSRSLTGWGRVFFCGLKRAGRINEQPLQIIHPSSGRRQVSAVTRRRIGSSSLNNETLYNEMLHGGSGQDKILRLRAPAGGTKFSFHRMSQTGPFTAPRLCFTQDARPSVPRPLQAGFRRERGPGVTHCAGAPIFWGSCEPID